MINEDLTIRRVHLLISRTRAHVQKKPHVCDLCGARSKNKNEAKRHYTTVHLKPFSWTCQKLHDVPLSAFQVETQTKPEPVAPSAFAASSCERAAKLEEHTSHPSTGSGRPPTPPRTLRYTCGFCGRTFHRKLAAPLMVGERLGELEMHVRTEHKFGMCSTEKKFFRDDHFAQHLKTVHAAVVGGWLKWLVESCKLVEG
jgi:hypothetical protein